MAKQYIVNDSVRFGGRVWRPGKDEATVISDMPDSVAAPLVERGILTLMPEGGNPQDAGNGGQRDGERQPATVDETREAIIALLADVESGKVTEKDAFTKSGLPDCNVLSGRLDKEVSGIVRAEAWKRHQAANADAE